VHLHRWAEADIVGNLLEGAFALAEFPLGSLDADPSNLFRNRSTKMFAKLIL
jgi:hypothetical protein